MPISKQKKKTHKQLTAYLKNEQSQSCHFLLELKTWFF